MAEFDLPPHYGEGLNRNEPIMIGSSDDEEDNIEHRRMRRLGGPQGTPIPRRPLGLRIFSPPPPIPFGVLQALPYLDEIGLGQHELMRMLLDRPLPRVLPTGRSRPPEPAPEPYDVRMTHASARPRLGFSFDFEQPEEEEKVYPIVRTRVPPVKFKQTIEIPDSPPLGPIPNDKGKGKAKFEPMDLVLDARHKEIIEIYSDDENEGNSIASSSQHLPAPATKITSVLICAGLALEFTLRHVHHAHPDTGQILWADADVSFASGSGNVHTVDTRSLTIQKPGSLDDWNEWSNMPSTLRTSQTPDWKSHKTVGPATDKRETLLALAKMTNNAYYKDSWTVGWYDLGGNWTSDHSIGYDPSTSGFRGHVFISHDNHTVVLSIKGTSAVVFGGSATVLKDKLNDNLLFSCCCARVDWTWSPEDVLHITHVYNTADPIPMGACTGPTSVCYQGGYAMETRCHLGQTIVYDTLSLLHWTSDIRSHFINTIIDQLLDEDWSTKIKKSRRSRFPWPWLMDDELVVEVPKMTREVDCAECFNWEYGEFPE
ncbi:unnamed protein product [Rhizoctonia solani]|uniref:triacylglycerol lipase n=1 Tax=Rhizoctonia solani TaxID=456999 RepID=A0A8H3GLG1_9AGAM|nr:unnamed protein product [Rhizoctonia solani]